MFLKFFKYSQENTCVLTVLTVFTVKTPQHRCFFIGHRPWLLLDDQRRLQNIFLNVDFLNPYQNHACDLLTFKKFACYYSCRLKACIFTESKLFCNTRSSTACSCSGKYTILKISQNSWVNNCAYCLEFYERPVTLFAEVRFQHRCFAVTFANFYRTSPWDCSCNKKNKQILLQQKSSYSWNNLCEKTIFVEQKQDLC